MSTISAITYLVDSTKLLFYHLDFRIISRILFSDISPYYLEIQPLTYTNTGLYRENAIAIESEAKYPFGGDVYCVTMQITLPISEFARNERDLHCDVLRITTDRVVRLFLKYAIAALQTSR